jgi:hypothetical protein
MSLAPLCTGRMRPWDPLINKSSCSSVPTHIQKKYRDVLHKYLCFHKCQKRPTTVSKETYYNVLHKYLCFHARVCLRTSENETRFVC